MSTDRRRRAALIVLCTGMLMIVLDLTVVNVALPAIQADLRFSDASLAWVVNSYVVAFGGLLLLAGRLGDLMGRRRIFLTGIAVFTPASLACGLAQNEAVLVAARFVQGIGGALTSAVILGMIVTESSPRRSTGTGSSSSTSHSEQPPLCWRFASSIMKTASGSSPASTSSGP